MKLSKSCNTMVVNGGNIWYKIPTPSYVNDHVYHRAICTPLSACAYECVNVWVCTCVDSFTTWFVGPSRQYQLPFHLQVPPPYSSHSPSSFRTSLHWSPKHWWSTYHTRKHLPQGLRVNQNNLLTSYTTSVYHISWAILKRKARMSKNLSSSTIMQDFVSVSLNSIS